MPIKSPAQFRLMEGAANGGNYGPSKQVAQEFIKKTPKKKKSMFAKMPIK